MAAPLDTLITVFGGSGFVGRHVVRALAKRDYRIRVAVRRPELAGYLQPLGRVGQVHTVQANIRNPASIKAAMRDASIVVNLVGILSEGGKQSFNAVQAEGAGAIAQAAAEIGAAALQRRQGREQKRAAGIEPVPREDAGLRAQGKVVDVARRPLLERGGQRQVALGPDDAADPVMATGLLGAGAAEIRQLARQPLRPLGRLRR